MTIDWQSVLTTVLVAGGGSVAVSGGAAWLLKAGLTAWIEKDTEAFKAKLKANADTEIERLKSSLQMAATEHQVRFSKMHERRADVIEDLYKRLVNVYFSGERFVLTSENNATPYQENEYSKMRTRLSNLYAFIELNRIWLPARVSALLDQHFEQINRTIHTAGIFGRIEYPNEHTVEQSNEAFTKAYKAFETDIPAARGMLEAEFRGMLGVEPG